VTTPVSGGRRSKTSVSLMSASVTSCHLVGAADAGSLVVVEPAASVSRATGGVGAVSTAARRSVDAADEPAARPRDDVVAGGVARPLVEDDRG
jgi:hypothetical protein